MSPTQRHRALIVAGLIVALVGTVDAVRGGQTDLAVLFGVLAVLLAIGLATSWPRRRQIGVRADLARWIDDRSALTGESADRIIDRAVADQRDRLRSPGGGGEP